MGSTRGLQDFLRRGGVIAYPTESCFGLGCDPRNRRAVQRLLRIKGRPERKGLILIASRLSQLKTYLAPLSADQVAQLNSKWPGPHTWLVPASHNCPFWLTGRHSTLAVRVTAFAPAARLCREAGMALVSTSANRSGQKSARTAKECARLFGSKVRVIPGRVGKRRRPSTIQDLATGKILRP
ncbi:MAG TPA: Sua5/YciO/YrdC/YwlC family protein [Methylophilaceae bacterium]|nr:Sua5/YciO/YrdC/YwlC family protein [Methylophilaceae bacterium]